MLEISSPPAEKSLTALTENKPLICLANISKTYPGNQRPAVENISLELFPGEVLALLGPSGCGKTTALRIIAGFEQPESGQVWLHGQVVNQLPPEKRQLGMVFQDYALFPHLTVAQNIGYGLSKSSKTEREKRVKELIALTNLVGLEKRYPHQLSGGQQQRVAIARALAPRPLALLLDEAFNSLDAANRSQMHQEVLNILRAEKVAALLVTHDQEEAFALADRMAVMRDGRIEQSGSPTELYRRPRTRFVAGFVGKANFLPATRQGLQLISPVGTFENSSGLQAELLELMLRPHELTLWPTFSTQGVTAQIISRTFHGAESRYTVRLTENINLLVTSTADFAPGEMVKLSVNCPVPVFFPIS